MSDASLTVQQQHVLTLLAQGSTVSTAAEAAGVHRNTVANWRRAGSPTFQKAWQSAQSEQAAHWRDEVQSLGDLAVAALRDVLTDQKTAASVRVKAALAILDKLASCRQYSPTPARRETSAMDDMIAESLHIPAHWRPPSYLPEADEVSDEDVEAGTFAQGIDPAQSCTTDDPSAEI